MSTNAPEPTAATTQSGAPIVAVTREVPGELLVPGAQVRVLGPGLAARTDVLGHVRGASVIVSMYTDAVDDELLDAAGPQLKGVANFAVGVNNIDLEACRRRGVAVSNTPDAVTEGTANLAWLLTMACARRMIEADRYARSPAYPANGPLGMAEFLGKDLLGKNLLIVGAGRIGYATALKAGPWAMRVGYVSRSVKRHFEMGPINASWMSLHEGLAWADVVSIHTPLTDETRGLIGEREFAAMKPGAILVNTSRGPVVDESALVAALESGRLFGAGLDVFENEPVVHPGLLERTDVVLTPHIGSAEVRFREMMTQMVADSAAAMLAGETPPNPVG
ncbi:MAG: glyoxylate reductase [Phycisphaerales bacterium]|jgi:glyoxylate reductase